MPIALSEDQITSIGGGVHRPREHDRDPGGVRGSGGRDLAAVLARAGRSAPARPAPAGGGRRRRRRAGGARDHARGDGLRAAARAAAADRAHQPARQPARGERSCGTACCPAFVAGGTGACATEASGLTATRSSRWLGGQRRPRSPVLGAASAETSSWARRARTARRSGSLSTGSSARRSRSTRLQSVDLTRDLGRLSLSGLLDPGGQLLDLDSGRLRADAAALFSAEAAGLARWCQETGAGVRQGARAVRPDRSARFQAIKHKCARLFVRARDDRRRRLGRRRGATARTPTSSRWRRPARR